MRSTAKGYNLSPQGQRKDMALPILYSLQNCPYAMRARLAILLAGQSVQLRAISMKEKPAEMLAVSPKGTVPVLLFDDGKIIEESLDIMLWALNLNDPNDLLRKNNNGQERALDEMLAIIKENDQEFKPNLERYKQAKRFHWHNEEECRLVCEPFVQRLEQRLTQQPFLMGDTPSLLDYAMIPFIRQFSRVNRQLYLNGPYQNLQRWLSAYMQSQLFSQAMVKYPLWLETKEVCLFGE